MELLKDFDQAEFTRITARLTTLESDYSKRNTNADDLENIFLLNWEDEKPAGSDLKITISPDPHNKATGAIRLMTAANAQFSLPYEKNDADARKKSEPIEKFANALWYTIARVKQSPIEHDASVSAVVFGEVYIGVYSTKDLAEFSQVTDKQTESKKNSAAARFQRLAKQTPIMMEVYDPRGCYPEFDQFGLASFYRKTSMKSGEIIDAWGDRAIAAGLNPANRTEDLQYCDYWDYVYHVVWIEGKTMPLEFAEHGLDDIPIVCQIVDGSDLHKKIEDRRQPFLQTMIKTGIWKRQNLSLTVLYTQIARLGSSSPYVLHQAAEDDAVKIDMSAGVAVTVVPPGAKLEPLGKIVVDPSVGEGLNVAERKGEESTMYGQTLGQPLGGGGNQNYSAIAMLNQAGRLPLVTIQRRTSWALGKAMEVAIGIIKKTGSVKLAAKGSILELKPGDIPESMIIDCKLDISLPQDEKQNAFVANQVSGGENPLTSRRYAREAFLNIGQSKDMQDEIWEERAADLESALEFAKTKMEVDAAMAALNPANQVPPGAGGAVDPNAPPMNPNAAAMPPGMENLPPELQQAIASGQISPEQAAQMMAQGGAGGGQVMPPGSQMPQEAATSGMPLTEPLPIPGQGG